MIIELLILEHAVLPEVAPLHGFTYGCVVRIGHQIVRQGQIGIHGRGEVMVLHFCALLVQIYLRLNGHITLVHVVSILRGRELLVFS